MWSRRPSIRSHRALVVCFGALVTMSRSRVRPAIISLIVAGSLWLERRIAAESAVVEGLTYSRPPCGARDLNSRGFAGLLEGGVILSPADSVFMMK